MSKMTTRVPTPIYIAASFNNQYLIEAPELNAYIVPTPENIQPQGYRRIDQVMVVRTRLAQRLLWRLVACGMH